MTRAAAVEMVRSEETRTVFDGRNCLEGQALQKLQGELRMGIFSPAGEEERGSGEAVG